MSFVAQEILDTIDQFDQVRLDALPFGVIGLDDEGRVLAYNRHEEELTGVPRELAMGSLFFTEVAPCCANRIVQGRFARGVEEGRYDETFDYVFSYRMVSTPVRLHLYRSPNGRNWLFVKER